MTRTARRRPRSGFPLSSRRLRVLAAFTVFGLVALAIRLVQLQGFDAPAYAMQAEKQRLVTVDLTAQRGEILDRNGNPLARDVDARTVYADPKYVPARDAARIATRLAPLVQQPVDVVRKLVTSPGKRFVVLARGLSPSDGRSVIALDFPGIHVITETRRTYPMAPLAQNVIGSVGCGGSCFNGLEGSYNGKLSGHSGYETYEQDPQGREIPSGIHRGRAPEPGTGLRLTLDRDIQWFAEDALQKQVAATGARGGAVVVLDPKTGDVLALASTAALNGNDVGNAFSNWAVSDVYEPGSVNKVITAAAAIQEHVVSPDSHITVPPQLKVADRWFHDAEVHGTEQLTFSGVLAKSSNIGTIEVAQQLGFGKLYQYLRAFGFGAPTNVGLPGETSGLLPPLASWSGTTGATIAFGQGMSVNALQMASVYATIANGGVRMPPRLVNGTVAADGTVTPLEAGTGIRVVSAATARTISDMLEGVTTIDGTAPAAALAGYRVAGKTGTADRIDPVTGRYQSGHHVASFVGFAPADKPAVVVEAVLDDPLHPYFGGVAAAPVFHSVLDFTLKTLRVPPTGTEPPRLALEWK